MTLLNTSTRLASLHLSCFCFFPCWYHKKISLTLYVLPSCESLIFLCHHFLSPQTLPAGIISTGATWSPSTGCATTSFMASSAASPVPIQTYNYLRRLSLTKEHFRLAKKDLCGHTRSRSIGFVLCLWACGKNWTANDIEMDERESCRAPSSSPGCRTSGYKKLAADSTAEECDQDSPTKGNDYEEKPAKWRPRSQRVGLTMSRENWKPCRLPGL